MNDKTKKCKYCQIDIPKKAKICPNCKKKQGSSAGWILIAVGLMIVIGVLGGGSSDAQQAGDNTLQKAEVEEKKNEFVVGDVVETSDLKITFVSADEYDTGNEYLLPKEGHVFYRMQFEFENISKSDVTISSMLNWTCYADDYAVSQTWVGDDSIDVTLSGGKKAKGSVYYEVPADAKNIIVEYETNLWTESKVIFVAK